MLIIAISIVAVVAIGGVVAFVALSPTPVPAPSASPSASSSPSATASATPTPTPTPTPTFDTTQFSIDDASSLWVVANKQRPLNPATYEPNLVFVDIPYVADYEPYLTPDAAAAAVDMFAAFTAETGLEMQNQSSYRSYESQERVYAGWVSSLGQEAADLTSARPGHSEHQTGLSIDVSARPANCSLEQCFADTAQGQWLAANGWKYGFTVRYQNGKTDITGYEYEPWHMRFVGKELAAELTSTGIQSLEEFFDLGAAPTYG